MRGVALSELFPPSLFGVFRTSHQMMAIKKALLRNINFDSATSSNSPVAMANIDVTTLLALFATEASSLTEGVFLSFLLRVSFHDFALDLSKMFVKIPALLLYWAETEPLKKLNDS